MYAVIANGGKQYRVAPGDLVRLEKLDAAAGAAIALPALAVRAGDGQLLAGGEVRGTVVEHRRAAKILVFHYKRKKQYKKLQGHRQSYSTLRVETLTAAEAAKE